MDKDGKLTKKEFKVKINKKLAKSIMRKGLICKYPRKEKTWW